MILLQTERLLLYALTIPQLEMALGHPEWLADQLNIRITPDVFSDESRQAMMIKMSRMAHVDLDLQAWYTYFLIVQAQERCAVGVCGFKGAPTIAGTAEVGYAMHPDYRNRGYMTETVRALIAWAFTQPRCKHVIAETLHENFASQRVLQKAGMALDRSGETMLFWRIDKEAPQAAGGGI